MPQAPHRVLGLALCACLAVCARATTVYDPKAGVDDWGVEDVKQWVLNLESVNPKGNNNEAAEILAREGVDGHRLLWLNQHHLDDDYKLPPEQRLNVMRGLDRLKNRIQIAPNDFWEWRAGHRRHADILAAGLGLCPRFTIYWMHIHEMELIKGTPIKKMQVGDTGLKFWTAWLLCPRLEVAYFASKFDTHHPELVKHAWVLGSVLTATEWLTWLMLIVPYASSHRWNLFKVSAKKWPNPFGGAIGVGFYWVLYPLIPHHHTDTFFNIALALPYLLVPLGITSVFRMARAAFFHRGPKED